MNIFEALRESHEQQRNLAERLIQTSGHTQEREDLFKQLKNELYAHSVAEDRYLYIPLMFDDVGLDITRHALSEQITKPYVSRPARPTRPITFIRTSRSIQPLPDGCLMSPNTSVLIGKLTPSAKVLLQIIIRRAPSS